MVDLEDSRAHLTGEHAVGSDAIKGILKRADENALKFSMSQILMANKEIYSLLGK